MRIDSDHSVTYSLSSLNIATALAALRNGLAYGVTATSITLPIGPLRIYRHSSEFAWVSDG